LFDFDETSSVDDSQGLTIKESAGQHLTLVAQTLRVVHLTEPRLELKHSINKSHPESLRGYSLGNIFLQCAFVRKNKSTGGFAPTSTSIDCASSLLLQDVRLPNEGKVMIPGRVPPLQLPVDWVADWLRKHDRVMILIEDRVVGDQVIHNAEGQRAHARIRVRVKE
jgi:hypothetical protein